MASIDDASQPGTSVAVRGNPRRLVGVDVARAIALVGLVAVHTLPSWSGDPIGPSLSWLLFSGNSAALFALLAGVGLGLTTGGGDVHRGRRMTADRVGLLVRAVLIGLVGLAVGSVMPVPGPAAGILLFYAMFFLLAIPFLHLRARALVLWAAGLAVISPFLVESLWNVVPGADTMNPSFHDLVTEPLAILGHLLVTGAYPALRYLTYILAGMAVARLDLRSRNVQAALAGAGVALAVGAKLSSQLLLHVAGGFDQLLAETGLDPEQLRGWLVWGPDERPEYTGWWLVITTPHTNTPFAVAYALGVGLAVLGGCLLLARVVPGLLGPVAAVGSMTFTLYTAHLLALATEVHYDAPVRWFTVHVVVAAVFAPLWQRLFGQGPLERVVSTSVRRTRRTVLGGEPQPPPDQAQREVEAQTPMRE